MAAGGEAALSTKDERYATLHFDSRVMRYYYFGTVS